MTRRRESKHSRRWRGSARSATHTSPTTPAWGLIRTPSALAPARMHVQKVFYQAEDGIRDTWVTGVQTCALPISCQIYDFGEPPDGIISLAMEFIEGQSLTG